MSSETDPEPEERGFVIYIGQDVAGHWLVQDGGGRMEGRFVSHEAAMSFAVSECDIYHAVLKVAAVPLVPLVSFDPLPAGLHTLPRAA